MSIRKIIAITQKELISFFCSPLAYIVLTVFLLINGYVFYLILRIYSEVNPPQSPPLQVMFGDIFFWLLQLLMVPIITMRTLAEERESGMIELTFTVPVRDIEVILGKFLGAILSYTIIWGTTIIYAIILYSLGKPDIGPIVCSYIGIFFLGCAFISMGIFSSSISKTQLSSAIICFLLLIGFFSIGFIETLVKTEWIAKIAVYLSVFRHFEDFTSGILDTRHVVYYILITGIFLFCSVRVMESQRWR